MKMDSRVRGNDGGNPHILREKLILEFPQNDREKVHSIPANAAEFCEKKRRHSRESGNLFGEINFGIFRKTTGKSTFHSRLSDSPPTFVGGETSSAEFTPPRNFRFSAAVYRLRKMPGFAAVNCCGLFRPRQMSGARNLRN